MTAYQQYMAQQISEEIKSIEDPIVLGLYLHAIVAQRCRICGAKEGTCKEGVYEGHQCRELYKISKYELLTLDNKEDTK